MKMKVAIIIPNWNGAGLIRESLGSLKEQTYKADVIVVDNGSVDESIEIIEQEFTGVKLIKLPENTGFDGGVNTGLKDALKGDYDAMAVYNNDAIADKDWLKNLVNRMESDDKIGIVSCKQLYVNKKYIDSSGDEYSVWGMPFPRGRNKLDKGQYDKPEEIFSAPAAATLYRRKLLQDIGLFDEKYFAYYEDVDISFRAQLSGWKVHYEPMAVVYHHVSATSSKLGSFTRYHCTKNFFILYTKNMPGWLYWKYLPLFIAQSARLAASSLLKGGGLAYFKGVAVATVYLPSVILDRLRIQVKRKVSTGYIDSMLYKHRPPKIPPIPSDGSQ